MRVLICLLAVLAVCFLNIVLAGEHPGAEHPGKTHAEEHPGTSAAGKEMETIKGTVICLGCTLKKEQGAKAQCSVYGHQHAIKTDDGRILTILENDKSTALVKSDEYNGKTAEITGRIFSGSSVVEVEDFVVDK